MNKPSATIAQMLIRKPVAAVFNAFIDPAVTTKFWFTQSSGKLEEGKTLSWTWEMYNATTTITVYKIVPNQLITISWADGKVDFIFKAINTGTYITIAYYDYPQNDDTLAQSLIDNVGGFTTVLDGAKCWLENGINLNLIADKFPKEAGDH